MTQPRKEQIKNIQAKHSPIDPRIVNGTVGPGLGPTTSTAFVVAGSPSPLAVFLASSVTGVLTGCVDTSPGFIQGTVQGPFTMAAGQQFSITCPQLNSGTAIVVTIQSGDIVTLGGFSVLTTSRLAARINAALAAAMTAASFTTTVATNFNGYLRLQTPTVGDACTLVLSDITAGLLNVFIGTKPSGAAASPSITTSGFTAPKRGIVVSSPDGMGGFAPVRMANGEPCTTRQLRRLHMGGLKFVPNVALGQDIYAKVSGTPGVNATVSFFTQGSLQPKVISASSNFSTLNGTDTLTIVVTDPLTLPSPAVLSTTFSSAPTTAQAVADAINATWAAINIGFPATHGLVASDKAVYSFVDGATFGIVFNGSGITVSVTVTSAIKTQAQLATTISTAITGAGASGGVATALAGSLYIGSTSTNPLTSSVQILAGTAGDMRALNEMGISPGIYQGTAIATVYGNDEIVIANPSRNPGASLTISASGPTLAKLGLTATTVGVTTGEEPAVPGAPVKILIPEAMEFGEVPSDQDITVENFLTINRSSQIDSTLGLANAGKAVVLGLDGKFVTDLASQFPNLSLESISLGSRSLGSASLLSSPRITAASNSDNGYTLLMILPDVGVSLPTKTIRFYVDSVGNFVRTVNCSYDNVGIQWNKDTNGAPAYLNFFSTDGNIQNKARLASDTSPWPESGWRIVTAEGLKTPGSGGLIQAGFGMADTLTGQLIARTEFGAATTNLTLIQEISRASGTAYCARVYFDPVTGGFVRTCNAKWDGTSWSKDVTGQAAVYDFFGVSSKSSQFRAPANDTAWTLWDDVPYSEAYTATGDQHIFSGYVVSGNGLPNTPIGRTTARFQANHNTNVVQQRTLISSWVGGNGTNIRLYRCYEPSGTFTVGDCTMETCNARWDETSFTWVKDSASPSTLTVFSIVGRDFWLHQSSVLTPFADSAFAKRSGSTANGLQLLNAIDTVNVLGTPNLLNQNNIVKAWGAITVKRSGGGVLSVTLYDSYNVSSVSLDGSGLLVLVNLYAAFSDLQYSVIASPFSDLGVSGWVPGVMQVDTGVSSYYGISGVALSGSQIGVSAFTTSGTNLNLNHNNSSLSFMFVAIGRQ